MDLEQVASRRPALKLEGLSQLVSLYRPRPTGVLAFLGYMSVMFLVYLGWQNRMEQPLTAESGLGYLLGIIGGVLMLLLLLYPLRKHARFMRRLGPVKFWFRTHMLFGVLGPVCILFHSGFRLGSTNSNVALMCMLMVASSGLVGRYFYTRIHHGLYGRKATLDELKNHSKLLHRTLSSSYHLAPWALSKINNFEKHVCGCSHNLLSSLWTLVSLGVRTWTLYLLFRFRLLLNPLTVITDTETDSLTLRKTLAGHIGAHLASIRKVAEFHFYERLFGVWHVLHFPLFLMLIVSGFIHVIVVHLY